MAKAPSTRFTSLDGLRGLAMILVFLNHITPTFLLASFPIIDKIGLFSSGVTGVSILFILSGFLMAYLYPQPKNGWEFLQKRYTRIFPLFLSVCGFMLFFSLFQQLPWYIYLIVLCSIASGVHVLWVYGVKKIKSTLLSKALFFLFFIFQISIGGVYVLWIMRKPPIFFQQILPFPFREALIGFVNATLTFPLGNYIPMLDGVYWSLAAEVLFYVIYPFVLVPIIWLLLSKGRILKLLFLLSLMPFLAAMDILSHHIFVLSALQFSLFYYFATGIVLAYLYKRNEKKIEKLSLLFTGKLNWIPITILLFSIMIIHLLNSIHNAPGPWIRLLFAIPLTLLVGLSFNSRSFLNKVLSSKALVFIGTISYSIYLSHSVVIHVLESIYKSTNAFGDVLFIFLSSIFAVGVASGLYVLLEKPYFISPKKKIIEVTNLAPITKLRGKIILVGSTAISVVAVFIAFQSQYNFFSKVVHENTHLITPQTSSKMLSTKDYSHLSLSFRATENNLGIIAAVVEHVPLETKINSVPMLTFSLTEVNSSKPIFSSAYVLDEFKGEDFPFGFPTITNSRGKTYIADFSIPQHAQDYISFDIQSMKAVYQLDKTNALQHPSTFIFLIVSKLQNMVSNSLAIYTLGLLSPFFLISIFLAYLPEENSRHI